MGHVTREELLRVGEAGRAEIARLAAHLSVCPPCRALAASVVRERTVTTKRAPPLKLMAELASFEKAAATERLFAKAELAELRRLTPGAQKERVILSRFCHSSAFLDALLDALRAPRSREESESLATLALLAAQGMDPAEGSEGFKNDLLAKIWTETANARRMRGEWQSTHIALLRAEEHGALGTGDERIEARRLSIAGSLQCDHGRRSDAMASLEESRQAYASCGEWPQVGRTLVTMAHCITDDEPDWALSLLDRAYPYIPPEDAGLRSLMERIRTDCLVTVGRVEDAFRAFAEAERLRPPHDRPSAALRSTFLAARLLETLGHTQEADLHQARKRLSEGTGDLLLKARVQSVSASLFADQGRRAEALAALDECVELYERKGAWPQVARTLVQTAHTLVDTDPARALALAAQALPMIPAVDTALRCLAENIHTDGMINLGDIDLALQTFDRAEPLRSAGVSPVAKRRSDFIAARLLEHLDHPKEAVQLFEAVIADAFDHEAYREAFLDLLYLFSLHLRQGAMEKAVALCHLAIDRLDLFGLGHEQLREVWMELEEAAKRHAVTLESLAEVRTFLQVHWKHPAARAPRFSFRPRGS